MDIEVPDCFVREVEDERLRRLIEEAWACLPAPVREIVGERLTRMYVRQLTEKGGIAAVESHEPVDVKSTLLDSLQCSIALDLGLMNQLSEDACIGTIFHEWAHVFLGHQCWQGTRAVWSDSYGLVEKAIDTVLNWEADLYVWLWGFRAELLATWKEARTIPPPWYKTSLRRQTNDHRILQRKGRRGKDRAGRPGIDDNSTIRSPTNTHRQATRDMPRDQCWRNKARRLLLALIEENHDFQLRAKSIGNIFPQFTWQSMLEITQYGSGQPIGWWDETGKWVTRPGINEDEDAVRYCREIEALTQEFGLRCKWGPDAIHHLVSQPGTYPGNSWWPQDETITITLQVQISPGTKWGDVKSGILKEAKRQFEAAISPLRTGFPERDRGPDNLERDVGIFYESVCLGLGPLQVWSDGLRKRRPGTGLTYETIREIVSKTARLLGIAL